LNALFPTAIGIFQGHQHDKVEQVQEFAKRLDDIRHQLDNLDPSKVANIRQVGVKPFWGFYVNAQKFASDFNGRIDNLPLLDPDLKFELEHVRSNLGQTSGFYTGPAPREDFFQMTAQDGGNFANLSDEVHGCNNWQYIDQQYLDEVDNRLQRKIKSF
jgi:hypothetical protein